MKRIFILLAVFSYINARGQVTMMTDISIPYLDHLIELAEANYPKFKYTDAKANSARAAYTKAKCSVVDFITLSYVYLPTNYPVYESSGNYTSALNGYQAGIFLNVGSMLEKPAVVKEAKAEYTAAKLDKEVVDLDLVQEVRKRYFTYVQQSNILKIKTSALDDADGALQHAKFKFEKGEESLELYNQALLAYSTYSQDKIMAESALLIAKTNLEEMLGTTLENIK